MAPVTSEEPGPFPGQLLAGRYRLGSLIAAGGMGEVWGARDEVLSRPVAVKLIKDVNAADRAFLNRFRAEARFAALLSHPGVAQIFDYGEQGADGEQDGLLPRRPFLVMELVPGRQLSALIAQAGALPAGVVLDITAQAARALQAAHNVGITHRDVKPANLLITDDGRVKITDFGIAGAGSRSPSAGADGAGPVLGTAVYMSPEQAAGKTLTPASDIYSLGIVAYQCVAGTLPFAAETPLALALEHSVGQPRPLPAGIPGPVRELIMTMIAKDPAHRPPSAEQAAEAAEMLRIQTLPAGGPQLADVAAWVAAGIGDPLSGPNSLIGAKPVTGSTVTAGNAIGRHSPGRRHSPGADPASATTPLAPGRGGRAAAHLRRIRLAAALTCVVVGGLSALVGAMMFTGSPAPVTGHAPRHSPAAQAPVPVAHPTAHHSNATTTAAPLTAHVGPTQQVQQTPSARPSAPPSTYSAPPPTHGPSPPPTHSPSPSPSPNPTRSP